MRSPEAALADVLARARPLGESVSVPLCDAVRRVLASDVHSDVDLPPFQKSAMDGYAVRSSEFGPRAAEEGERLEVVGESRAGRPFAGALPPRSCVLVATGAEVPSGLDAVVIVERSIVDGDGVRLRDRPRTGQNICNRGEDLREGALALAAPRRLSPTDLSVLAAVGADPVPVFRRPRVALLSTGDELVPAVERPAHGQIRESNTAHLAALAQQAGAEVVRVERVRDAQGELEERFASALEVADVLITTGGVSMGRYDLVGECLSRIGVEEVFHKVAIKPGKPIWFGVHGPRLVFGLPGNPVSCLLDHEVFVRPALARLEGAPEAECRDRRRIGRWLGGATRSNPREQNLAVRVVQGSDGVEELAPLEWSSSADIVGLADADGMAVVPPETTLEHGQLVEWRPLRA